MLINIRPSLDDLYIVASAAYRSGFQMATPTWNQIAMEIPSGGRENHYPWLGVAPKMREWLGDRVVKGLSAHDYTILNRKFESTIGISRDDIDDDLTGTMRPVFERMGTSAAQHPDELIYQLVIDGGTELCYDGQPFFSDTHPGIEVADQSNQDTGGAGPYWYLLDTRSAIRPFVFQRRRDYNFIAKTAPTDNNVFEREEYLWGVDARVNAGFGLWQHAYRSNQTLNETNLEAAETAMESLRTDQDQPMGIEPNLLLVPKILKRAAMRLVENQLQTNGGTNVFRSAFDVLSTPQLPNV